MKETLDLKQDRWQKHLKALWEKIVSISQGSPAMPKVDKQELHIDFFIKIRQEKKYMRSSGATAAIPRRRHGRIRSQTRRGRG